MCHLLGFCLTSFTSFQLHWAFVGRIIENVIVDKFINTLASL